MTTGFRKSVEPKRPGVVILNEVKDLSKADRGHFLACVTNAHREVPRRLRRSGMTLR